MKMFYKLLPLSFLPVIFLLLANSTGSIGGKTGSPGDGGTTCSQCHIGNPVTTNNWITTNIPQTGYVPGQTYTITVTGTHTGVVKFGFELTAEDGSGNKTGTFVITNATQTQLTNGNKAVTHKSAGTTPTGNSKTWTVSWTAPAVSAGPVTFYAALNAANGNGQNTGDVIYKTSTTVQPATMVNVTFRVDMSFQTVSPLGVHIAGSFQNPPWQPGATPMNAPPIGKVYFVTIPIAAGTNIQYKFVNGNAWGMDESVPAACATGGNRTFTVPNQPAVTIPTVCYGSCNPCTQNSNVTFRINMSEQTVGPNGVFLAGTMNNWNTTSQPMTAIGNGIYELTKSLPEGETVQYKFINGTTPNVTWEQIPAGCAIGGNRYIVVPANDTTLPAFCFNSCVICAPPSVNVTFNVDMTYETVSPDGVHIAGTFNGWSTSATPMLPLGNNVYSATLSLAIGNSYEYKFINGNTSAGYESVPPECALNNNRSITVGNTNTVLDTVCFAGCSACGPPPVPVQITFQVDMSDQTIAPEGVHIAGTFQGWDPGATLMTPIGQNVYSHTATVNSGTYHEYKFINGNTFGQAEFVPEQCANNGNRFLTAPSESTILPVVCYASCEACPPPLQVQVTFKVDMSLQSVSNDGIHLAGSFNNWNYSSLQMLPEGNGIYSITVTLTEGDYHTYRFVNGNSSSRAEVVPPECGAGDPFAGYNRYLTVPGSDLVLDAVCYGACGPCIPPPMSNVTFRVDMSGRFVAPDGIHLAGSFQGWNPASTPMNHTGNNVYEVTLSLVEGQHYNFKYINGITFGEQEVVPEECGEPDGYGGFNRFITVPADNLILSTVCFGECTPCPALVDVTFRVDMTLQVVSPEGIHITGSFQGWNPGSTLMLPERNGIYSVTVPLLPGEYYEFKYVNGNTWEQAEQVPGDCNQNGNRYTIVPFNPVTLDLVCFGMCEVCPLSVPVTFRVDMANEDVSPDGIHLVGDFQGWDSLATPMTNIPGGTVYEVTVSLLVNSYQTYRFLNGNSFVAAEQVPAECGVDDGFGGYKRYLNVPTSPAVLPVVCFASCLPCPVSHMINLPAGWSSLSSYVMPGETNIEALLEQIYPELVILQDMTGMYYPAGGINTLINWDSQSAYKIKLAQSVSLTITGQPEVNKTVQLDAGWNLIPVISPDIVDVILLFSGLGSNLLVVTEVAGSGLYWPAYGINTIGNLQSGRAYFIKVANPAEIIFP